MGTSQVSPLQYGLGPHQQLLVCSVWHFPPSMLSIPTLKDSKSPCPMGLAGEQSS